MDTDNGTGIDFTQFCINLSPSSSEFPALPKKPLLCEVQPVKGKSSNPDFHRMSGYVRVDIYHRAKKIKDDNDGMEYSIMIDHALDLLLKDHGY